MQNSGLHEARAEIKIDGRNTNNLRYADDTTFMTESKEELKSLLMKVKEDSEKVDLKLNIQKKKIMVSSPITSWGRKYLDMTEWLHFSLSCTGEGNGNPLQYSCLKNPRDGGAWWAAVCG